MAARRQLKSNNFKEAGRVHNPARHPASCVAATPLARPKSRLEHPPPAIRETSEKRRLSKTIPFTLQKVTFCTTKPYLSQGQTIPFANQGTNRATQSHNNHKTSPDIPKHKTNRPRRAKPQQAKTIEEISEAREHLSVKKKHKTTYLYNNSHYLCNRNQPSKKSLS